MADTRHVVSVDTFLILEAILAACPRLTPTQARAAALNVRKVIEADPAATRAKKLAAALRDFVDDDPCSLDHHGYCQAHGWLNEGECHMVRARAALAEWEGSRTGGRLPEDVDGCWSEGDA